MRRDAFRVGYLSVPGIKSLLPEDEAVGTLLFDAFEVEKAVYELGYEKAYRPNWVAIPTRALERLLPR